MASEAVTEALANLRQAMLDDDMDEGTVDAILHAAQPNETSLVGNLADLNRLGAARAEAGEEPETFVAPAPAGDGEPAAAPAETDLASMTKADLQAKADAEGVEVPSGATKADLVAALGG